MFYLAVAAPLLVGLSESRTQRLIRCGLFSRSVATCRAFDSADKSAQFLKIKGQSLSREALAAFRFSLGHSRRLEPLISPSRSARSQAFEWRGLSDTGDSKIPVFVLEQRSLI